MSQPADGSIGVREAARRLGVHENSVRNWHKRGILAAEFRANGRGWLRFDPGVVEELRASLEADAASPVPHWLAVLPFEVARMIESAVIRAMLDNGEDAANRELYLLRRDWLRAEIVRRWSRRRAGASAGEEST